MGRRAATATLTPCFARATALALPMPELAACYDRNLLICRIIWVTKSITHSHYIHKIIKSVAPLREVYL
jgi:hypothetical protein